MEPNSSEMGFNPIWSMVNLPTLDATDDGRHSRAISKYIEKRIMGAATLNLLLDTFDFIIVACKDRNSHKALRGITALERSLDFHTIPDLAQLFLIIYRYCRQLIKSERFGDACTYISGLRSAWEDAMNHQHNESRSMLKL
jgi:flagellin-specific chaperone FliS